MGVAFHLALDSTIVKGDVLVLLNISWEVPRLSHNSIRVRLLLVAKDNTWELLMGEAEK